MRDFYSNTVFVYGSLRRGYCNHQYLEYQRYENNGFVRNARMRSFGAFPCIEKVDARFERAYGEVYSVTDECLRDLDRLESHPNFYKRELTTVWLGTSSNGLVRDSVEAWCYWINCDCQDSPIVSCGDWSVYKKPEVRSIWA